MKPSARFHHRVLFAFGLGLIVLSTLGPNAGAADRGTKLVLQFPDKISALPKGADVILIPVPKLQKSPSESAGWQENLVEEFQQAVKDKNRFKRGVMGEKGEVETKGTLNLGDLRWRALIYDGATNALFVTTEPEGHAVKKDIKSETWNVIATRGKHRQGASAEGEAVSK